MTAFEILVLSAIAPFTARHFKLWAERCEEDSADAASWILTAYRLLWFLVALFGPVAAILRLAA